jgi:glycosyltransferase involved in cell wall biosynthesis
VVVDVQRMPKGQMRLYDGCARLRANSTAVLEAISAERPAARSRVRVFPNPLTSAPAPTDPWADRANILLYAGRIHPEKGLALLLQAWAELKKDPNLQSWELHLIGPVDAAGGGGGQAWWNELRQRYPTTQVVMRDPVYGEDELNRVYAAAKLFVYPSVAEKGETFGSAVLESMSHGTPAIVSDLACFTDFVRPGDNGWSFNHRGDDAVAQLERTLREAMSQDQSARSASALQVNQTHAPSTIAGDFLTDFSTLIKATRS